MNGLRDCPQSGGFLMIEKKKSGRGLHSLLSGAGRSRDWVAKTVK